MVLLAAWRDARTSPRRAARIGRDERGPRPSAEVFLQRSPVLELLERYLTRHPAEGATVTEIRSLVEQEPRCLERDCYPGHLTASAWIVSPDRDRFLLAHHRKLGRWLQLGGHADGQSDLGAVALREAREESGMHRFVFAAPADRLVPLDVDVHRIPAHGREPPHHHHDVRFLLVARPDQALVCSGESTALQWFRDRELESLTDDESVLRLGRKARVWLADAEVGWL